MWGNLLCSSIPSNSVETVCWWLLKAKNIRKWIMKESHTSILCVKETWCYLRTHSSGITSEHLPNPTWLRVPHQQQVDLLFRHAIVPHALYQLTRSGWLLSQPGGSTEVSTIPVPSMQKNHVQLTQGLWFVLWRQHILPLTESEFISYLNRLCKYLKKSDCNTFLLNEADMFVPISNLLPEKILSAELQCSGL